MILTALAIVIVLAIVFVIGAHVGPHGSLASAIVGAAVGVGAVVVFSGMSSASVSAVAWTLMGLVIVGSGSLAFVSLHWLRKARLLPLANSSITKLMEGVGTVSTALAPVGTITINGESWTAETLSGEVITPGTTVFVNRIEGLKLFVIPEAPARPTQS
ncbi:MAG: NfeD family protein [Ferrimicrobium sp.]